MFDDDDHPMTWVLQGFIIGLSVILSVGILFCIIMAAIRYGQLIGP